LNLIAEQERIRDLRLGGIQEQQLRLTAYLNEQEQRKARSFTAQQQAQADRAAARRFGLEQMGRMPELEFAQKGEMARLEYGRETELQKMSLADALEGLKEKRTLAATEEKELRELKKRRDSIIKHAEAFWGETPTVYGKAFTLDNAQEFIDWLEMEDPSHPLDRDERAAIRSHPRFQGGVNEIGELRRKMEQQRKSEAFTLKPGDIRYMPGAEAGFETFEGTKPPTPTPEQIAGGVVRPKYEGYEYVDKAKDLSSMTDLALWQDYIKFINSTAYTMFALGQTTLPGAKEAGAVMNAYKTEIGRRPALAAQLGLNPPGATGTPGTSEGGEFDLEKYR